MKLFNFIYLDRKATLIFYVTVQSLCFLLYWVTIYFFIQMIYEDRNTYIQLFNKDNLTNAYNSGNWTIYQDFYYSWGKEFLFFIGKIFAINLFKKGFQLLSVPTTWIGQWQKDNDIDNIFGRLLCEHFRYNGRLSFYNFYRLHKDSRVYRRNFKYIKKNDNLMDLFSKHDNYYEQDTKYYD